jgi:hypothetical protein
MMPAPLRGGTCGRSGDSENAREGDRGSSKLGHDILHVVLAAHTANHRVNAFGEMPFLFTRITPGSPD